MESPDFDQLDLKLLHGLEVDARVSFSRLAAVLGVSDQTVARRFRRLQTEGGLRVVGVRDAAGLGQDTWMLRLRCAPDAADSIARALARRPDTAWIGLTSGGTEVVGQTRARTRSEHEELLLGKLPRTPSITEIRAHQLLHRFYGGPEGWLGKSRALTDVQVAELRPSRAGRTEGAGIAPEDEPMITALEHDGRASFAELRKATGRSESAVRRRLDQLLGSGTLFIDVQFDSEPFGYGIAALLWITAAPSALDTVGRALATHPEVATASAVSGPCNLFAVVVCRDTPELYAYVSGRLGSLEGVQHVECTPMLRRVKQLKYEERLTGRTLS
ncbi:Lrp/AsnC family transcriptional regulator [Streptomyces sp. NBC_00859]|uniref:Lrp/AsnC family transcriptional regulator n=1 Tax=Streptomyces sp. NBC_00859 TaxID=2903682 RepID=UPI0038670532|nr:Lrp/AsnC family transcriptional regulator [Streptomyces sp. NBC_00859]